MVMRGRLHRWYQLTRYYVNLWKYDSQKWVERVWYGVGTGDTKNTIASVPFMITRAMRIDLEKQGFPRQLISTLSPVLAHDIIKEKLTYVEFLARKVKRKEREEKQDQLDQQATVVHYPSSSFSTSSALIVQELKEEADLYKIQEKESDNHQHTVVQQTTDKS
jgi:hypothetical protein